MTDIPILETKHLDIEGEPFIAKRLKLGDVPVCLSKLWLLTMVISRDAPLWVVGKPGNSLVGDWAAYIGHPPLYWFKDELIPDMQVYSSQSLATAYGIARYGHKLPDGHKLPEGVANRLFPEYAHLKYRP